MKKLISCCALLALMGNMRAENEVVVAQEETQEAVRHQVSEDDTRIQLTEEQQAACKNILNQLQTRYAELNFHKEIEAALQEVADANRQDFDVLKSVLGEQLNDGSWVCPLDTRFIVS